jgi:hypothetical protein
VLKAEGASTMTAVGRLLNRQEPFRSQTMTMSRDQDGDQQRFCLCLTLNIKEVVVVQ